MCPAKVEKVVYLGDFTVSDGNIAAADPCRKALDDGGSAFFSNCAVGLWHAFVLDDSADAYKLIAIYSRADAELASWTISLGDSVSVLSGQAGIFDRTRYRYDQEFYERLCDLTARGVADSVQNKLAGLEAWCFDWGTVTATALGDGNFLCYTLAAADGTTVGVAIDFYPSYTSWADISLNKVMGRLS
ncbi:MAG: hypothetical protein JST44_13610 [Cyanobacteria bacterium SZAS LIN-5]|nr:hypothetical protein [Cyanobacteria bacterium SZAS LIN-5]